MVPCKRPRTPSLSEYSVSDLLPEKEIGQVKNFLELCRFCKKKMRHDEDVFMYGYLGAFCSKECRAKQMACDIFRELPRQQSQPKKGRMCGIKPPPTQSSSKDEAFHESIITSSSPFSLKN